MSDVRDPNTDSQDAPVPNDSPYIQGMVIKDVEERLQFGIRKYGVGLQPDNGRDMLQDAYEEVLDLVVYLRGEIEDRKTIKHTKIDNKYIGLAFCQECSESVKEYIAWPCNPVEVARLAVVIAKRDNEFSDAAVKLDDLRGRISEVLDNYNELDDDDTVEQCAPEDRWRLFRDLRKILEETS